MPSNLPYLSMTPFAGRVPHTRIVGNLAGTAADDVFGIFLIT
ncbi:hypothetical protein FTUN_3158 [Frigoriglobus tundricola]|uniref:Uncharacterized protein n=1 Tax=Frigoriglobus tundricola TaxID=2774151 RepID=A0A6M5YNS5_9BACT|nr:hypothetical protein FTUN_3158 [Frigoriglobus tundricola]